MDNLIDELLQNCGRHEVFAQGSARQATFFADDVGASIVDPYREHHRESRWRERTIGYEEIETTTTTRHYGNDREGGTISSGSQNRPIRVDIEDEIIHYWNLADQIRMIKADLRKLGPGWRWVYDCGRVWKEYVPLLKDPWSFMPGVADQRVLEFLEEQACLPFFQQPQVYLPKAGK